MIRAFLLAVLLASFGGAVAAQAADPAAIARGGYLFTAADCTACHTDSKNKGALLAGGAPIKTEFGIFVAPNITPDPDTGIGTWSEADFARALRQGEGHGGDYLYPVFPFTSFTGMSDGDISDLYAYLMSLPAVTHQAAANRLKFPFNWRPLLVVWRVLFFKPGPLPPIAGQSADWNRGRYLAEAVVHCQECHTPRNFFGALDRNHAYAGNPKGPDDQKAPDITPDPTGIAKWSLDDIAEVLKSGQTPDFDSVGGGMGQVVDGTSKLTDADRQAIAIYVKSLPPQRATGK